MSIRSRSAALPVMNNDRVAPLGDLYAGQVIRPL